MSSKRKSSKSPLRWGQHREKDVKRLRNKSKEKDSQIRALEQQKYEMQRVMEGGNRAAELLHDEEMHLKARHDHDIQNIEASKLETIQRLNNVLLDLDKVTQDKSILNEDLLDKIRLAEELQKILDDHEAASANLANGLKSDLNYERTLHDNQRNDCLGLEKDIKKMRKLLREQEKVSRGLDKEQAEVQHQLNNIVIVDRQKEDILAIDAYTMRNNELKRDNLEREELLNKQARDRAYLLDRVEDIRLRYEQYVSQAHSEKRLLVQTNTRVLAKILDHQKKQNIKKGVGALNDFVSFDKKFCHKSTYLVKNYERHINDLKRAKLQLWQQTVMKFRIQKDQWTKAIDGQQARAQDFLLRDKRQATQERFEKHMLKFMLSRDEKDVKMYFDMWRDKSQFEAQSKKVLLLLMNRKRSQEYQKAFYRWFNHTSDLRERVRLNAMLSNMTREKHIQTVWVEWKAVIQKAKQNKFDFKARVFKALKNYVHKQKHLRKCKLKLLRTEGDRKKWQLKEIFEAMRDQKEECKAIKCLQELEIEAPKRAMRQRQVADTEESDLTKAQTDAISVMFRHQGSKLFSYFQHWKTYSLNCDQFLKVKFKMMLVYNKDQQVRRAFYKWNHYRYQDKHSQVTQRINQLLDETNNLQDEDRDREGIIAEENEMQRSKQSRQLKKCAERAMVRTVRGGLQQWMRLFRANKDKERALRICMRNLRKVNLENSFEKYKQAIENTHKEEWVIDRLQYFKATHNERLKAQVYANIKRFSRTHQLAKEGLKRCLNRTDDANKRRAYQIWLECMNREHHEERQEDQNNHQADLKLMQTEVANTQSEHLGTLEKNKQIQKELTTQSRRILSNYFARSVGMSQKSAFIFWKQHTRNEKHREALLGAAFAHYFNARQAKAFLTWKDLMHRNQDSELEAELEQKTKDLNRYEDQLKKDNAKENRLQKEKELEIEQLQHDEDHFKRASQNAISKIVFKNGENDYMSKKRYILFVWRQYVKEENRACKAIVNCSQKYLWNLALQNIKDHAKDEEKKSAHDRALKKFFNLMSYKIGKKAFDQWKSGCHVLNDEVEGDVDGEAAEEMQEFKRRRAQIVNQSLDKAENVVCKRRLYKIYHAWRDVIKCYKLLAERDQIQSKNSDFAAKRKALALWIARKNKTKEQRQRKREIDQKLSNHLLRKVWRGWACQTGNTKYLETALSNLEKRRLDEAFHAIRSFKLSKDAHMKQKRELASNLLEHTTNNLLNSKLREAFNELKHRIISNDIQKRAHHAAFARALTRPLRQYFLKWRDQTHKENLAKEMYEEGPIRLQEMGHKQDEKNLRDFLKDKEEYETPMIDEIMANGQEEDQQRANRILNRMKMRGDDDDYLKPIVFDRWIKWVRMRKLFKHWLDHCNKIHELDDNQISQYYAFQKWKGFFKSKQKMLERMPREDLEDRVIECNKKINDAVETLESQDDAIAALDNQNGILEENRKSAVRLALALCDANYRKAQIECFKRWLSNVKKEKNLEKKDLLKQHMEQIVNTRARIKELQMDNDYLVDDNEDLRQTSMDGIQLAQTVKQLTKEIENLSVDLAHKSSTIKSLLDEILVRKNQQPVA